MELGAKHRKSADTVADLIKDVDNEKYNEN